jgi:ABC-type transport system involved in multi-copper enzyme maturation permease subunit
MTAPAWRVPWTLITSTWREKTSRPLTVVLLLLLCATQTAFAVSTEGNLSDPVFILTLFLASGCIGREVSSGTLGLLFTRPIRRSTYVLSKWFAASAGAAVLAGATLTVQAIVLNQKGIAIPGAEWAAALFHTLTSACGLTAVLVLFSTLLPGVGDVVLWGSLSAVGYLGQRFLPMRITDEWRSLLQPALGWTSTFQSRPIAWFALTSYLSTITLCLSLAVLAANKKDLSYASG